MGEIKPVPRVIWQFWTGDNPITANRSRAIESNGMLGVPVCVLSGNDLLGCQVPNHPFHEAYQFLSCNHKADYLRAYFMRWYGGGYADIKPWVTFNNWIDCFETIRNDLNVELIGVPETPGGVVPCLRGVPGVSDSLVECGWMICRPGSEFVVSWLDDVDLMLDRRIEELKSRPSTSVYGGLGYPLHWQAFNEIYHKRCMGAFGRGVVRRVLKCGWDYNLGNYR